MDGDLIQTNMSSKVEGEDVFKVQGPLPAPQLLAEVLANAHSKKFCILLMKLLKRIIILNSKQL